MKTTLKIAALAAALAGATFAAPAFADGSYHGPKGGSVQWQGNCYDGAWRTACHRDWQATTPDGRTYSGGRTAYRGPWRAGVSGHVSGPQGTAVYGRAWRRW